MTCPPLLRELPANAYGSDWIVGDIHGHPQDLERLLDFVGFDPVVDRVISVGDLIDRGPSSEGAIEWLDHPWFFAVRGNHEQMMLDAQADLSGESDGRRLGLWYMNGGGWFDATDEVTRRAIVDAVDALPYAITLPGIKTSEPFVIVHAGLLGGDHANCWHETRATLERGQLNRSQHHDILWSRALIQDHAVKSAYHEAPIPMIGAERVYLGHTPLQEPLAWGNIRWLDTGRFAGGKLTMSELRSERVVSISSDGRVFDNRFFHPSELDHN